MQMYVMLYAKDVRNLAKFNNVAWSYAIVFYFRLQLNSWSIIFSILDFWLRNISLFWNCDWLIEPDDFKMIHFKFDV